MQIDGIILQCLLELCQNKNELTKQQINKFALCFPEQNKTQISLSKWLYFSSKLAVLC